MQGLSQQLTFTTNNREITEKEGMDRSIKDLISKKTIMQFVRFGGVGLTCAGIHYGIYYLLKSQISSLTLAFSIGYLVAFVANFLLTTFFTFQTSASYGKALGFVISHVVNYLCNLIFFKLFIYLGVSENIAPILAIACSVPINFLILKRVFVRRENK